MIKFKQITAVIMAVATMATTTISASAENVAKEWMAVYQSGAPSSVNKIYVYDDVPAYGKGYKVDCTYFLRGYDSLVIVTPPTGPTFRFTGTGEYERVIPYIPSVSGCVTFQFSALESTTNCVANGRILYNNM